MFDRNSANKCPPTEMLTAEVGSSSRILGDQPVEQRQKDDGFGERVGTADDGVAFLVGIISPGRLRDELQRVSIFNVRW